MSVVFNKFKCTKHRCFAKGLAFLVLSLLLLFSSCTYIRSLQKDAEAAFFEDFTLEETIAWIKMKLKNDLEYSSGKIESLRVEPCHIIYSYQTGSLSGLPLRVEQDIPTDDVRITKAGSIIYTITMRSNCPTIDDEPVMRMRLVVLEMKVRRLKDNGHHHLTRAIEHLNSFCKEEI